MLNAINLEVSYGGIRAVRDVSLSVGAGEVVAVLGRNGAGKTTTLRALAGDLPVSKGRVELEGHDVTNLPSHAVARRGLALVPEGREIFASLTVEDNLKVACPPARHDEGLDEIYGLFPVLRERCRQLGGTLSGGQQQMLAIGRGLVSHPHVLAVDEPSLGLAPVIMETVFAALKTVAESGRTVLLVEQNARLALQLADRVYVLRRGVVSRQARSDELSAEDLIGDYV